MFRIGEIVSIVRGQLLYGSPQSIVRGISIDSRTIKNEDIFIAIKGKRFDGHNFIQDAIKKGVSVAIISNPDKYLTAKGRIACIKVFDTRRALAELARFHRKRFDIPVIAVTGSNGKTTTKDMIAWILSSREKVLKNPGSQNNDIGVPLTLLKLNKSHRVGILELGTNHFGEIGYLADIVRPNLGIITNIGPAHLEYLGSLSGVYREKVSLLKYLSRPKIAILNSDEPRFAKLKNHKGTVNITYGINNKCDFRAEDIKLTSSAIEFVINSDGHQRIYLKTVGYANIYNALASIVVSRVLGYTYREIKRRLASFPFSPGRLKLIKLNNILFIDDTYNSNPASLSEALGALSRFKVKGRKIFVMSDMLELGRSTERFHLQAGFQIARVCDAFISVGKFAELTARQAIRFGLRKKYVLNCESSSKAKELLFKIIKPTAHDLILVKGSRFMRMEEVLNH